MCTDDSDGLSWSLQTSGWCPFSHALHEQALANLDRGDVVAGLGQHLLEHLVAGVALGVCHHEPLHILQQGRASVGLNYILCASAHDWRQFVCAPSQYKHTAKTRHYNAEDERNSELKTSHCLPTSTLL